jgi:hypothetical protein
VAAIAIVAVRRVVRRRRPDGTITGGRLVMEIGLIVFGASLMTLSLLVGQRVLAIEEPPHGEQWPAGVGIKASVRPKPNRGFMASLGARFDGCDRPVAVTIVLAGSAEYFEDREAALGKVDTLTIAVPGKGLKDLKVGYGDTYFDLFDPLDVTPTKDIHVALTADAPREQLAVTSVKARMRAWRRHLAPIVVRFQADWLAPRGLGTCYLKLPPLVGDPTILGAEDASGLSAASADAFMKRFPEVETWVSNDDDTIFVPYDTGLTVRQGISVVDPGKHEVLDSRPDAQIITGSLPGIACSSHSMRTGFLGDKHAELVFGDEFGVAMRERSLATSAGEYTCDALVTLAEAGAGSRRDLVLLLIGAVFSLGSALVLEIVLDMQRRRYGAA